MLKGRVGCHLRVGQQFGISEGTGPKAILLEPSNGPARFSVEVVFLFGKDLDLNLIDHPECGPNRELPTTAFQDWAVAGVNSHTRSKSRLGEVDRSYVPLL